MAEAQRIADRQNPLADFEIVGVGQLEVGQVLGVNFYNGDIGFRVGSDNFGVELSVVGKLDFNFFGILDHMVVCEDITISRDNKTGAHRCDRLRLPSPWRARSRRAWAEEKIIEILVERPFAVGRGTPRDGDFRLEPDNRRRGLLGNGGKGIAHMPQGGDAVLVLRQSRERCKHQQEKEDIHGSTSNEGSFLFETVNLHFRLLIGSGSSGLQ